MQDQRQKLDQQCGDVRTRPVFVDVHAQTGSKGEIEFSHDWRLKEHGPGGSRGPIDVPHGTPRSPLHFKLRDTTGRRLRFFEDSKDAIWAKVDECPDCEGGGGQIDYKDSISGGPNLKVHNLNSEPCELHFALRFKDEDDIVETYDPVIRNGGGGP